MAHYNSAAPIPARLAWLMIPMLLLAGVAGSADGSILQRAWQVSIFLRAPARCRLPAPNPGPMTC